MLLNCGVGEDLRVPWHERRPDQSMLRNQSWIFIERTDAEAEAPILWPPRAKSWFIGKDPDAGKDWEQGGKWATENEMVGRHHWLNEHEFQQTQGDSKGQESLVWCSPWGSQKVRFDLVTEQQHQWKQFISNSIKALRDLSKIRGTTGHQDKNNYWIKLLINNVS